MNNTPTRLFNAATADGNSLAVPCRGDILSFVASGGFGGGTLTVQVSPDGTTWVNTALTLTAPGFVQFQPGQGLQARLALAGATAATLSAWVAFER